MQHGNKQPETQRRLLEECLATANRSAAAADAARSEAEEAKAEVVTLRAEQREAELRRARVTEELQARVRRERQAGAVGGSGDVF